MQYLTIDDLKPLSRGAALLGSGGGGDPGILYSYTHYLINKSGPLRLLNVKQLTTRHLVVPIALIGAPLISAERIPSGRMYRCVVDKIAAEFPEYGLVLMPAEVGGCNLFSPMIPAAIYSLPILDADLIGRAFPKLNMTKPAVNGKKKQRVYMGGPDGACLCFDVNDINELEIKARDAAVEFGGSAVIAVFVFPGNKYRDFAIVGTVNQALCLGSDNSSVNAQVHFTGVITEVNHAIDQGFLTGSVVIESTNKSVRVYFQNEYLFIKSNEEILAKSPEIIAIIESSTNCAITSDSLRYGLKVNVVSLPAPDFWLQSYASSFVSLTQFGFSHAGEKYV